MRLLLLGLAPLPSEDCLKNFAGGARTWQFARALAQRGHEVRLLLRRIPGAYANDLPPVRVHRVGDLHVTDATWDHFEGSRLARRIYRETRPDALVGATIYGSHDACRVARGEPVWVDLYGDPMAEAQAHALVGASNRHVVRRWQMFRLLLQRGDVFSAVSDFQGHAAIGQLGAVGRLGRETAGYPLVTTIPVGFEEKGTGQGPPALPGAEIDARSFVVSWSGSYNVWADVETLFRALEGAMAVEPRIVFVSTGGAVEGYDESTYGRFEQLVGSSPHRQKFLLKGWLPGQEAARLRADADVGIVLDRFFYEGLLGTKTRIVEWMAAGIPAIVSELSELSHTLAREQLGFTVPVEDVGALTETLITLARDRARVREVGARARAYVFEHLTYDKVCAPLLQWADSPYRAPDSPLRARASLLRRVLGGSPPVRLSMAERLRLLVEPVARHSGLKRLWLRRRWSRPPRDTGRQGKD